MEDKSRTACFTYLVTPLRSNDRKGQDILQQVITDKLLLSVAQASSKFDGLDGNWKERIQFLNLSHCNLRRLENLSDFFNLRTAIFSHNRIERIENLESCRLLEELNMESNVIEKITGLENLVNLKKLELGTNKIRSIQNLG